MAVSQNGWSANDRSVIETYTVGKGMRVPLRKGDAGFLLKHVADWFDANIKDIDFNYNNGQVDDWGYAERPIRGGEQLSNHASGTAIDVNATNWPLGVEPSKYLTQDQINRLRQHLKVYEGAIRWGGDYTGRKDPMHFEINASAATVSRVANKLRSQTPKTPQGGEEDDMASALDTRINFVNPDTGKLTTFTLAEHIAWTNYYVSKLFTMAGQKPPAMPVVGPQALRDVVKAAVAEALNDAQQQDADSIVDRIVDRLEAGKQS